jgi:hypothetical protein
MHAFGTTEWLSVVRHDRECCGEILMVGLSLQLVDQVTLRLAEEDRNCVYLKK